VETKARMTMIKFLKIRFLTARPNFMTSHPMS